MNIHPQHHVRKTQARLFAYRVRPNLSVDGIAFSNVGEAANKAVNRLRTTLNREEC